MRFLRPLLRHFHLFLFDLRRSIFSLYIAITSRHRTSSRSVSVFYGGAGSGNVGGPLVKLQRLKNYFPEHYINYNLIYGLSNSPYLHASVFNLLRNKRIPFVLNQNGIFYPGWFNGDCYSMNTRMQTAYHHADYVFWQSNFCRHAADFFLGKRHSPGEVLYNSVDTGFFSPDPSKAQNSTFVFLHTGKIPRHANYSLSLIISALSYARLSGLNASLWIAGLVEDVEHVHRSAHSLNVMDFVNLTGPYTQAEAPSIYTKADAYITLKYQDNCPNAVVEAMACGLPVLYSASGGTTELVGTEAGLGLDVPQDWDRTHMPSVECVCQGMHQIAASSQQFSSSARTRALTRFSLESWIAKHQQVFHMLLSQE